VIISILGSVKRTADLKKYLPQKQVELVCSNKTQLDLQIKEYADKNNIPCLVLNFGKDSKSRKVLNETRKTMIDICDYVLILVQPGTKNIDQYINYCKEQSKYYVIHDVKEILYA